MPNESRAPFRLAGLGLMLLAGTGCEDRPVLGTIPYPPQAELHGRVVLAGPSQPGAVEVKAAGGVPRTVAVDGNYDYVARVTELTPVYFLQGTAPPETFLFSVAMDTGLVNITPLTTLVVAQLFAQDPYNYFYNLQPSGDDLIRGIGAQKIAAAQQSVVHYLEAVTGVAIPTGSASFFTTPFEPVAGDPMFDEITALNDKLTANGLTLTDLQTQIAQSALLCTFQQISVTRAGTADLLCPAFQSTLPDEVDSTVSVFGFTTIANDTLEVRAQGPLVQNVRYANSAGEVFSCAAAACQGVSLGATDPDGSQPITFAATALTGSGTVTLSGTLSGAPSGVTLPPLYCTDGRWVLIRPDRSVDAVCGGGGSGYSGTFTLFYAGDQTPKYHIDLALQGETIKYVVYSHYDENFYQFVDFACENAGCSGITLGPIVAGDFGQNFRRVTFDNAPLAAINPDSSLSTTSFAHLTFSFNSGVSDPGGFPPPPDCTGLDSVRITYSDGTTPMSICPPPNSPFGQVNIGTYQQEDGELGYYFIDANFDNVQVNMVGNEIRNMLFGTNNSNGMNGTCAGADCTGITVSAPDSAGERSITFSNTVLREGPADVHLSAFRASTLNGTINHFPPLAAPSPEPAAIRKLFEWPHPLSPSPTSWRGGTECECRGNPALAAVTSCSSCKSCPCGSRAVIRGCH